MRRFAVALLLLMTIGCSTHVRWPVTGGHSSTIKNNPKLVIALEATRQIQLGDGNLYAAFPASLVEVAADGEPGIEVAVICSLYITGTCLEIRAGQLVEIIEWDVMNPVPEPVLANEDDSSDAPCDDQPAHLPVEPDCFPLAAHPPNEVPCCNAPCPECPDAPRPITAIFAHKVAIQNH